MGSPTEQLAQLVSIAYFIVLPVLLLIALGYALQRRLGLDMPTLTRLNFFVVVPAIIFFSVVSTEMSAGRVAVVVGYTLTLQAVGGLLVWIVMRVRGVPVSQHPAAVMTQLFFNAGNYGLPLQGLVFRGQGLGAAAMSLQVFVMIVQNITSFTVGVALAAIGGRAEGAARPSLRETLRHVFSLPPIWAVTAAVIIRAFVASAPSSLVDAAASPLRPFWDVVLMAKDGFMVVALVTLGAQLALVRRAKQPYPVTASVVLRLLASPVLMLGLIWMGHALFGIDPFVAQVLLIASSTPTAVNAMLICLEFDNHPDFLARAVFWSTAWSPLTVTAVILLSRTALVPG